MRSGQSDLSVAAGICKGRSGDTKGTDFHIASFFVGVNEPVITLALVQTAVGTGRDKDAMLEVSATVIFESFTKSSGEDIPMMLGTGFQHANRLISQLNDGIVGCSVVAAAIQERHLYVASCGCCRAFLINEACISQLSIVHSASQILLDEGHFTLENLLRSTFHDKHTMLLGIELDERIPDFRIKLTEDETDAQAKANQGMCLTSGDQIVLITEDLYGSLGGRQEFTGTELELFRHTQPQQAIDAILQAHSEQGRYKSVAIVALKIP